MKRKRKLKITKWKLISEEFVDELQLSDYETIQINWYQIDINFRRKEIT